jgi:hypothetical protein
MGRWGRTGGRGLDRETAARLAEARLAQWRRSGPDEWRGMLADKELRRVIGEDGRRYNVVSYAIDDGDGRIRLCVAVDDGGLSAFSPLVRTAIMGPDGALGG